MSATGGHQLPLPLPLPLPTSPLWHQLGEGEGNKTEAKKGRQSCRLPQAQAGRQRDIQRERKRRTGRDSAKQSDRETNTEHIPSKSDPDPDPFRQPGYLRALFVVPRVVSVSPCLSTLTSALTLAPLGHGSLHALTRNFHKLPQLPSALFLLLPFQGRPPHSPPSHRKKLSNLIVSFTQFVTTMTTS